MFSLLALHFLHCSCDLNVPRACAKDHRLFCLNYPQISEVRKSSHQVKTAHYKQSVCVVSWFILMASDCTTLYFPGCIPSLFPTRDLLWGPYPLSI